MVEHWFPLSDPEVDPPFFKLAPLTPNPQATGPLKKRNLFDSIEMHHTYGLKKRLHVLWRTPPIHDQGLQHQSGTSSVLQTPINVPDLQKASWYLKTQQISTILFILLLYGISISQKYHQEHHPQSWTAIITINSNTIVNIW